MKLPKILFFIKGPFASEEEKAFKKASEKEALVVFRNALAVPPEKHALETCDGVAGAVPAIYAKTFPKAEKAISDYKKNLAELSAKVGDAAPPKKQQAEKPKNPTAGKAPAWNPNANPPA